METRCTPATLTVCSGGGGGGGGGGVECRRVLDSVLEHSRQAEADREQRHDGDVDLGVAHAGQALDGRRTADVDVAVHGDQHGHVDRARVRHARRRPPVLVYIPDTPRHITSSQGRSRLYMHL